MSDQKVIHKYAVPTPGSGMTHNMPRGAEFAHVGIQEHESFPIQAWFIVDPDAPTEPKTLALMATGQPFPDSATYLGTVIHDESQTVWHLLEQP